ncbi:MAG TPA: MFS transporter [Methylomirabilota bacterium]|nr:MFS transporter [Methylomirabilota bacterium]
MTGPGAVPWWRPRAVGGVRPAELRALGWAWLYILSVLCSYYILRPIRDEAGVAGGVEHLPWLFLGTLAGMLAVNPLFAGLVRRLPRARFITIAYRFFMANLLLFVALFALAGPAQAIWVGRVFFIWTSVFNLFVVSVFWALMVDVFDPEQGRRLFGVIAAGASVGALLGSGLTAVLAGRVGVPVLLLVSILLLEVAVFSVGRLARLAEGLRRRPGAGDAEMPIGGGVLAGITHTFQSAYLVNVSVYMLLYAVTSTFLYFEQAAVVAREFQDRAARTTFFAQVDLLVNALTLLIQLFITGPVLRVLGVAVGLAVLPALSVVGFAVLGLAPVVAAIVAFQVARRTANFAVARPTREVLFTVVAREDKYKAKSFIDTVVYRTGDQLGAWSWGLLGAVGLGVGATAWVAASLSVAWLLNGWWLGRRHERLAGAETAARPGPEPPRRSA